MAIDRSKFIAKFAEEAREHIHDLNCGLISLEKGESDGEILNTIFRAAHSIKGTSRMLKLTEITELSHKLESVLHSLRSADLPFTKDLGNLLFKGTDKLSELIELTASGQELKVDLQDLHEELESNCEPQKPAKRNPSKREKKTSAKSGKKEKDLSSQKNTTCKSQNNQTETTDIKAPIATDIIKISSPKLDELINLVGEMTSIHTLMQERLAELSEACHISLELNDFLQELAYENLLQNRNILNLTRMTNNFERELDRTLDTFKTDIRSNSILSKDLQRRTLEMRMLPLSSIFDSFHKSIDDMSRSLKKRVKLLVKGGETKLDKKMIEKLSDPLMHMIRNAIDHGIELPEERIKKGKSEEGTIELSAMYESGNVIIVISDDGKGISISDIEKKAIEQQWYNKREFATISRQEKLHLIFRPGFSTSQFITDFSGRGVGMDVVKGNIVDALKGVIHVETNEGYGSTFTIRLPSTLAIMRLLLFRVSGHIFSIPTDSVIDTHRVREEEIVEIINKKALKLENEILPLVHLAHVLKLSDNSREKARKQVVIIVNTGIEKVGIIVDKLLGEQAMVIKPLPQHMQGVKWVSGVSITGKGEVLNVLHVPVLLDAAREEEEVKSSESFLNAEIMEKKILVVDDSINTREIEKDILMAYGYSVDLASDGVEALEKARNENYDLVITDVEMPRMDGFSLTEELKKEAHYNDKPVIIVTSRDKVEDKKRGMQVGASAYILKGSFDQSNLLNTVESLIGSANQENTLNA